MAKIKNPIKYSPIKSSDVAIPLPVKEMQELAEGLPKGAIAILMKRTGLSRNYIQQILKGEGHINSSSRLVVAQSKQIIKETSDGTVSFAKEVKK